jgi:ribosomal protein L37E
MKVRCPNCFFKFDVSVKEGKDKIQCICPRCGESFEYNIPKEGPAQKPETKLEEKAKPEEPHIDITPQDSQTEEISESQEHESDEKEPQQICRECGQEFNESLFVCPYCGAPIEGYKYCPECNELVSDEASECQNCGYIFNRPQPTQEQSQPTQEQPQTPIPPETPPNNNEVEYEEEEEGINNNTKWILGVLAVILIIIIICFKLNHQKTVQAPAIDTDSVADTTVVDTTAYEAPVDSIAPPEATEQSAVPSWLPGTYSGSFSTSSIGAFDISIEISSDGYFSQTISNSSENNGITTGNIEKYDDTHIYVKFNGESSYTTYIINSSDNTISIGENMWLSKE